MMLPARQAPVFMAVIKGSAMVNGKQLQQPGDFIFIQPGEQIAFTHTGSSTAELAFFELK
jgi:hypothetical protein